MRHGICAYARNPQPYILNPADLIAQATVEYQPHRRRGSYTLGGGGGKGGWGLRYRRVQVQGLHKLRDQWFASGTLKVPGLPRSPAF